LTGDPNFYAYVDNNPLRFADPLGLDKDKCGAGDSGKLKWWIYAVASGGGGFGPAAGEGGEYFLVDPFSGETHVCYYASGGVGLGFGGAAQLEAGLLKAPSDPRQMSDWTLTVSGFVAAGKGVSGQITGTSFWGKGEYGVSGGVAGGVGAGVSGMLTRSWYRGKTNVLPERIRDIVERARRECTK
jgi:hypothetical protein